MLTYVTIQSKIVIKKDPGFFEKSVFFLFYGFGSAEIPFCIFQPKVFRASVQWVEGASGGVVGVSGPATQKRGQFGQSRPFQG